MKKILCMVMVLLNCGVASYGDSHIRHKKVIIKGCDYSVGGFFTFGENDHITRAIDRDKAGKTVIDLDVDSNNDGIVEPDNKGEDCIENSRNDADIKENPGKVFSVNDSDSDNDGIIDYCDGFGAGGGRNGAETTINSKCFIKLKLSISNLPKGVRFDDVIYTFSYAASDPRLASVKERKEDGEIIGVTCYAPAGLRIWTNRKARRNRKSIMEGGDFVPSGVGIKGRDIKMENGRMEFYIEAIPGKEGKELAFNKYITVSAKIKGIGEIADCVRVNPVIMQFITRGDDDNDIVPTKYVGVSTPRPEIRLQDITKSSIQIDPENKTATVLIKCDKILAPIADNFPEGVGEIKNVIITVDRDDKTAQIVAVKSVPGGKPAFWKQHPYCGSFDDVKVVVPLKEGTHVITVKTGKNSAGLAGFDMVSFTLGKREITPPGKDIYFNIAFLAEPVLRQKLKENKKKLKNFHVEQIAYFRGRLEDVPKSAIIFNKMLEPKYGYKGEYEFEGVKRAAVIQLEFPIILSDGIDQLIAKYPIGINDGKVSYGISKFTETTPVSNIFRYKKRVFKKLKKRIKWEVCYVTNGVESGAGFYMPFTMRIKGLPKGSESKYTGTIGEVGESELTNNQFAPNDGWFYIKP